MHQEKFNISDVRYTLTNKERELINGSGLFFWNSTLDERKKLKIIEWYNNLSDLDKEYIDILREERYEDTIYNCNESADY